MKKLSIVLTGIFVTLNISTPVLAEGKTISFKEEAGITPDSILYPVDKLIDEASLALKSDEEKQVEVLTDIAKERLGESEVMAEEGKQDLVEEALVEYEENMNEAVEVVDNIIQEAQKADDKDVLVDETTELTDEELADIERKEDEIEKLNELLTQQQEKSIEVLEDLKDTVGDEAKIKLEKVIEMQAAKKEAVAKLVEKRHEFNEQKKALNMAKVQLKKASKTGDEEAIKKAEEDYQLKLNSYNEANENMVEAKAQHKEVVKEYSGKENVEKDQDQEDQEEPKKEQEKQQQQPSQEKSKKEQEEQQQQPKQEKPKKEQEKQQQQPKQEKPNKEQEKQQQQPRQEEPKKEQEKQQQEPKQGEPKKEQEKQQQEPKQEEPKKEQEKQQQEPRQEKSNKEQEKNNSKNNEGL